MAKEKKGREIKTVEKFRFKTKFGEVRATAELTIGDPRLKDGRLISDIRMDHPKLEFVFSKSGHVEFMNLFADAVRKAGKEEVDG